MTPSLRGQLLIAARKLRDRNFFRSVVLMVAHNGDGAMGLVLNQPTSITVAQALESIVALPETGELVGVGGPVERKALFIVHNAVDLADGESQILEGLFLGTGPEVFETIARRAALGDSMLTYRIFLGCSGWGPDQLEGEIGRGDWLTVRARHELVFPSDPYELWKRCVAEYSAQNPLAPVPPTDFRFN